MSDEVMTAEPVVQEPPKATTAPKPKVKREPQPEEPKATTRGSRKETVVTESKALGTMKTTFIKGFRDGVNQYGKAVQAELDKVDVGHPHYAELKFAKIRIERMLFSLEELQNGKPKR